MELVLLYKPASIRLNMANQYVNMEDLQRFAQVRCTEYHLKHLHGMHESCK